MKLYIDTSDREKIIVGLDEKRIVAKAKKEKSQLLLKLIQKIIKDSGKKFSDISEVEVVRGPGSFTGLRVGITVANTIAWVLKIPINGQDVQKNGPIEPVYE